MRSLTALCLIALFAGFAPPERQPESGPAQVVQEKTWIPGKKPSADPPVGEQTTPPSPFAQGPKSRPSSCTLEQGDFSPEFKAAVDTAQEQYQTGDLDAALTSVETASGLATSDLQRYLVDLLRGQVFKSMRNRQGYEAALRSLIARDCFLVPGEREIWQQQLDDLTGRTVL